MIRRIGAGLCMILTLLLVACSQPEVSGTAETHTGLNEITQQPEGTLSVHFIDVGQADAILLICGGHTMLVDGGNVADSDLIYTYLHKQGVKHLDYCVNTHPHEDHVGGLAGALHACTVDTVMAPVADYDSDAFQNFKKAVEEQQKCIQIPEAGEAFPFGEAEVTVLNSGADDEDINNSSIVLRVVFGSTSFLLTGDAERESEQKMIEAGYDLSATVLKVGHHGSETSSSYPFLREVMPRYAIISVGTGNTYGHPDEAVVSRLRDAGAEIYRTDEQGDIVAVSDGTTVTVTTRRTELPSVSENQESDETPAQPNEGNWIGNRNSKKFHRPTCGSLPNEENRVLFSDRESAIAAGYSPCGLCNP